MRWNLKKFELGTKRWNLKKFELGTKRTVKRFAFWPTRLSGSTDVVWLEFYHEEQEYDLYGYGGKAYVWYVRRRY